jgi:hypothetical protein
MQHVEYKVKLFINDQLSTMATCPDFYRGHKKTLSMFPHKKKPDVRIKTAG